MHIRDLDGKSVCILGYGKEGKAMEEALMECAPQARITIRDEKDGPKYLDGLEVFDVIIKSPGIPPKKELEMLTDNVTTSTQIFLDSVDPETLVIGVTGSKGKSTVSSLIFKILRTGGLDVELIGNIGEPAIAHWDEGGSNKIFVQEMSSYQLLHCNRSPGIAVITSFFPEHLDYHGSIEAYRDAKANIVRFQKPGDTVFYNGESEGASAIASLSPGKRISYTTSDAPVAIEETHLIGRHNLLNIAGAFRVASHVGIDPENAKSAIRNFRSLPHRLERIESDDGITWIDDAISTTPESTMAGIEAIGSTLKVIILGGKDRGNDFTELGKVIDASGIETVIVMGESGKRIGPTIKKKTVIEVESIEQAVAAAKEKPEAPVVLLSPASPSYDQFKNFEKKGEAFRRAIQLLSS